MTTDNKISEYEVGDHFILISTYSDYTIYKKDTVYKVIAKDTKQYTILILVNGKYENLHNRNESPGLIDSNKIDLNCWIIRNSKKFYKVNKGYENFKRLLESI